MQIEELMIKHLSYTPNDGKVWWITHPRRSTSDGTEAGNIMVNGYRKLKFMNKQYLVHRNAWFLYYGKFPKGDIDHIDHNPLNNRISNLRDVSRRVNLQNINPKKSKCLEGMLGASRHQGKWRAQIYINGKQKWLGTYNTAIEANAAYLQEVGRLK